MAKWNREKGSGIVCFAFGIPQHAAVLGDLVILGEVRVNVVMGKQ